MSYLFCRQVLEQSLVGQARHEKAEHIDTDVSLPRNTFRQASPSSSLAIETITQSIQFLEDELTGRRQMKNCCQSATA